jgi:hypothetical protein
MKTGKNFGGNVSQQQEQQPQKQTDEHEAHAAGYL